MVGSDAAIFLEKMGKVIFGQRAGLSQILKTDRIGVIEGNIAISLHQSGIRGCIGRYGNGGGQGVDLQKGIHKLCQNFESSIIIFVFLLLTCFFEYLMDSCS